MAWSARERAAPFFVPGRRPSSGRAIGSSSWTIACFSRCDTALADHPAEKTISLLAIAVSHLEKQSIVQLELPIARPDEGRRPGTKKGVARSRADQAIDAIRKRFGGQAVDYGSALSSVRSVPDEFRRLAEKEL